MESWLYEMGRLEQKVAIITGAAQGLGAAYALALAGEGARVSICDIKEPDATVAAIKAAGGEAIGHRADVSDPEAVSAFVRATEKAFGTVDILINNAAFAGIDTPKPFMEISSAEWDQVMATNARGTFEMVKAVAPIMRRKCIRAGLST